MEDAVSSLQMALEYLCSNTEIFLAASRDRTWNPLAPEASVLTTELVWPHLQENILYL